MTNKMIFFDIDDTLFDYTGAANKGIEFFYTKYEFNKFIEINTFIKLWEDLTTKYFDMYLRKEYSFEEQRVCRMKELFTVQNIELSYEEALAKFYDYLKISKENWRAFEDVIPCLEKLNGFRLGIISNGDHQQQIEKLDKIGIKDYFEDIITPSVAGVAKPDLEIFKVACERNNVELSNCYYVGDSIKTDILPSKEIGMTPIFINRKHKEEIPQDVIVVNSLSEIDIN